MKTRFLSTLTIATLLFASCSNNDSDVEETNDGRIKFSSGVEAPQSRIISDTEGDKWEGNENIGIYMVDNGATIVAEGAENVKYSASQSGLATFFTSTNPIFYPVNAVNKVDFIAYHPHTTTVSNYEYSVDTKNQSNLTAIDLMRATADNTGDGYDKTNAGMINLVFDHKLTKLVFNTTPDAGLKQSDIANMTVTIKGLNTKAKYNIGTDVLDAVSTSDAMTLKVAKAGEKYEAIVLPQSFAANVITVEFALNNVKDEVFVYKVPAAVFARAEVHTFNVKVQRTGVVVRGTINAWDSVGAVDGTAK